MSESTSTISGSTSPLLNPKELEPILTLGRGSFGKVVLAKTRSSSSILSEQEQNDSLVAVKIIAKSRIKCVSQLKRAEAELKVLTEVAPLSPFVQSCKCAYQTDDLLVYVMDYSVGGDLRSFLTKNGPLVAGLAAHFAMQIAEGLSHLHASGVLYRDLKPENILITGKNQLKLTDFGLSKFLDERPQRFGCFPAFSQTKLSSRWVMTRTACGTPVYQCPEMVLNRRYGLEADWWAFGVVLFELLTGRPPFLAATVVEVHDLILQNRPSFPSSMPSDARNLIGLLLRSKRTSRLGCKQGDFDRIMQHPFFTGKSIRLEARSVETPQLKLTHCSGSFIPEFVAPSQSPVFVPGYTKMPNDAFVRLVSTDSFSEESRSSSCCESLVLS